VGTFFTGFTPFGLQDQWVNHPEKAADITVLEHSNVKKL
jgi:hypothetical protein